MKINKAKKLIELVSKLNLYKRYKNYSVLIKKFESTNTLDIDEFMKKSSKDKLIVLYSLSSSNKIKMDYQMKLLYILIAVLVSSTGINIAI